MGRLPAKCNKCSPFHAEHFCHYILLAIYYSFRDISQKPFQNNESGEITLIKSHGTTSVQMYQM